MALSCSEIKPPLSKHVHKHVFDGVLELLVPPDGALSAVQLLLFAEQTLAFQHLIQLTPILHIKSVAIRDIRRTRNGLHTLRYRIGAFILRNCRSGEAALEASHSPGVITSSTTGMLPRDKAS
jgi:hypothetical protein